MLPSSLQARVDAVQDPAIKQLITDIVAHFAPKSEGVDAAGVRKNAVVYDNLSLILPERRKVQVAVRREGIAVIVSDKVIYQGDWTRYNFAACLPVPDRPKPTWNLVVANSAGEDTSDSLVFTLGEVAADKFRPDAKPVSIRQELLTTLRAHIAGIVEGPEVQVTAHQGSKEGVLAFLNHYIFFGYRKPVALLPLTGIKTISYTVVTRLTFNVVVTLHNGTDHEFSMISHDHYDAINEYVTTRGLEDSSLAEERRAKKPKVETESVLETIQVDGNDSDDDRESDEDVGSEDSEEEEEEEESDIESDGSEDI